MSHYCIGNPCWICHPQYAPKQEPWPQLTSERLIPETGISDLLKSVLLKVFDQGLDEGTFINFMDNANLTIENLWQEKALVAPNSLETALIEALIGEMEKSN